MNGCPKMPSLRANDEIVASSVRVIDEEGNQRGIMPTYEALERARIKGLDIVEVAPDANPPICRWITNAGARGGYRKSAYGTTSMRSKEIARLLETQYIEIFA